MIRVVPPPAVTVDVRSGGQLTGDTGLGSPYRPCVVLAPAMCRPYGRLCVAPTGSHVSSHRWLSRAELFRPPARVIGPYRQVNGIPKLSSDPFGQQLVGGKCGLSTIPRFKQDTRRFRPQQSRRRPTRMIRKATHGCAGHGLRAVVRRRSRSRYLSFQRRRSARTGPWAEARSAASAVTRVARVGHDASPDLGASRSTQDTPRTKTSPGTLTEGGWGFVISTRAWGRPRPGPAGRRERPQRDPLE
jgi:hypothetical protein